MEKQEKEGLVIRVTGHEIWVDLDGVLTRCLLRGRFRQKSKKIHVVAGDRVEVAPVQGSEAQGAIEKLLPRASWLSRYAGGRGGSERVIVANIDVLLLVVAIQSPEMRYGFVDRVLVSAEHGHNETCIIVNKMDLAVDEDLVTEFQNTYGNVGYQVLLASAVDGRGLSAINEMLTGGVYAFVGQSGVGKSSLMNRIDDSLGLKVRSVADKTGRGRHTTAYSQLFPMKGGYLADTPGMQTFGFPGNDKERLADCFPEFRPYGTECKFQPCTHSHEPSCAVKEAHENGYIAKTRLKSYYEMLTEVEERARQR